MSRSASESKILENENLMVSPARWCEVHLIRVDRRDGDMCAVARRIVQSGRQPPPLACCIVDGWWVIREVCV